MKKGLSQLKPQLYEWLASVNERPVNGILATPLDSNAPQQTSKTSHGTDSVYSIFRNAGNCNKNGTISSNFLPKRGAVKTASLFGRKDAMIDRSKKRAKKFSKPPGSNCPTPLKILTLVPLYAKPRQKSIGMGKILKKISQIKPRRSARIFAILFRPLTITRKSSIMITVGCV